MKKLFFLLIILSAGINSCSFEEAPRIIDEPVQEATTDDDENDTNGPKPPVQP